MPEDQSRELTFPFFARFGALLALWLLLSWLAADSALKSRTRELIQDETVALEKLTSNTAQAIDLSLDYLHGIPDLVAKDEKISAALSRFGATAPSSMPAKQRRILWSQNSLLRRVNSYLDQVGNSLRADVVWVTNASGDCIASSNSRRPESFVGTNYADRDYFRIARKGKFGRQYAMGRMTNIPGLYFSAPITVDGRFAGVAVAKIDLPKLSHWVSQADAFISDEHGVIILARDPALEMRSLPGAAIARISEAERLARYKRTDFPPLAITPWNTPWFPSLRYFDQEKQPLLISSKPITDEALEVHVYKSLPAVADFERDRLRLFLLIGTAGMLVLSIVAGVILFSRIRKGAELRAAKSASLLRAAIESTVDGILVIDNEQRVSTCNQRFVDIWHIPPELLARGRGDEMLNYVLDQLEDSSAFMERVKELDAHPEMTSCDTLRFKDGAVIERYAFPQRLGDRIVGKVLSFRDITERSRAEQALRESRDELESKVQERTADLQSANLALLAEKASQEKLIKQLAEAHNQLMQSDKLASIGQLAAGVAHEINNPIGYVYSNMGSLERYLNDVFLILDAYVATEPDLAAGTPAHAKLQKLKSELDLNFLREDIPVLMGESREGLARVRKIVQDLKDFSRVDSSQEWQWVDLHKGLDSTLNVVNNEIKYKADVVKEYGDIPQIECLPSELNQVFMNLLVNAVHAIADNQHGRITLRTGSENGTVWVEVIDTGSGIAPENLQRIFEPFFTTKPVGKGTGLGLSLSYGIVQKHGGRIEVSSELGKGTAFRVMLPVQHESNNSGNGQP